MSGESRLGNAAAKAGIVTGVLCGVLVAFARSLLKIPAKYLCPEGSTPSFEESVVYTDHGEGTQMTLYCLDQAGAVVGQWDSIVLVLCYAVVFFAVLLGPMVLMTPPPKRADET